MVDKPKIVWEETEFSECDIVTDENMHNTSKRHQTVNSLDEISDITILDDFEGVELNSSCFESKEEDKDTFDSVIDNFNASEPSALYFSSMEGCNLFTSQIDPAKLEHELNSNNKLANSNISRGSFVISRIRRVANDVVLEGDGSKVHVSGNWNIIDYEIGMKVTILHCGCCSHKQPLYRVDNNQNLLFVEDDVLTISNFISSFECINRPKTKVKVHEFEFEYQHSMIVIGLSIHEAIQRMLVEKRVDTKFINEVLNSFCRENAIRLYRCNITETQLKNEAMKQIQNSIGFVNKIGSCDKIEHWLFSNLFGLRGNIDFFNSKYVVELKTGKYTHVSHRAQVIFYTLMLAHEENKEQKEKHPLKTTRIPMIFYTQLYQTPVIQLIHAEVRELVIRRNRVATTKGIIACTCNETETCALYNSIMRLDKSHWLRMTLEELEKESSNLNLIKISEKKALNSTISFKCSDGIKNSLKKKDPIAFYTKRLKFICKGSVSLFNENELVCDVQTKIDFSDAYYFTYEVDDLFYRFCKYSLLNIAYFSYFGTKQQECANRFRMPGQEEDELFDEENKRRRIQNTVLSQTPQMNPICTSEFTLKAVNQTMTIPPKTAKSTTIPIPDMFKAEFFRLNKYQQHALINALNCTDFSLIHGMPGTGKSTLIALLIKILVFYNKKVLLVCYTHLAINNLLGKLNDVRWFKANGSSALDKMTVAGIRAHFDSFEVIAGTCYSLGDAVFVNRRFDFCITDEGSQISLLLNLIPISRSDRFVIVGDHLQISPIKGNRLSLFEHLHYQYGSDELRTQYRMGEEIMKISNQLFYQNRMVAGCNHNSSVKFIDTATRSIEETLLGLDDGDTTVLCYFNCIVDQISRILKNRRIPVYTIDRFQGSESDRIVIIFDPILMNACQLCPRRLNVALTRARSRLILVGNRAEMEKTVLFRELLELVVK
ncbi:DNA2 [Enterospora canceri]|uniref:DNA2 n=1 Tax=Enterospora canceri TaxID=1081671 RepID=A0A1Y1S8I7_9MICR|nr:DNA2 [Enterospora canceri]